jgi:polyphenol oxidase
MNTSGLLSTALPVPGLPDWLRAWTTTRATGSFGLASDEPVAAVMGRWEALQRELASLGIGRLASAAQVHGAEVAVHAAGWNGWLRAPALDGHVTAEPATALAVTVADCTPVLVWHPRGGIAALHAGWRGTAAGILEAGLNRLEAQGFPTPECHVYLGPAICASCYEVGPEVLSAVTGMPAAGKGCLDVRDALVTRARRLGVASLHVSQECTRCHGEQFFSHRAGDTGRQLGLIALLPRE